MLQRNISGESASIKVSIEIEEFQQPVTFTCDGMFLLLELEFACERLYTQLRKISVFVIPESQGHELFMGNVEEVTEERTSSGSVPPSENI